MNNAIKIFKGSISYSDLFDSFSYNDKLSVNLEDRVISEAIYFHICKMKYAGWRHRVNFKRGRKHSFSEFFQDIISFYLKASLPKCYEVELETKKGNTQPDIAIKRGDKYVFIIETKTNIGWDRPDMTQTDPYKNISDRITELSTNFVLPTENVIYVFEEHSNVNRDFSDKFWDKELQKAKPRPTDFPFSIIYPLFDGTDSYYWQWEGLDKTKRYPKISDKRIKDEAKYRIVTPFEEILRRITGK